MQLQLSTQHDFYGSFVLNWLVCQSHCFVFTSYFHYLTTTNQLEIPILLHSQMLFVKCVQLEPTKSIRGCFIAFYVIQ